MKNYIYIVFFVSKTKSIYIYIYIYTPIENSIYTEVLFRGYFGIILKQKIDLKYIQPYSNI